MLSEREKQVLRLLENSEFLPARSIARAVGVSEKTVRKDVRSLQRKLETIAVLEARPNQGLRLYIVDRDRYHSLFVSKTSDIPVLPQERVNYILRMFTGDSGYIKTEEIADKLYQSVSTISADLKTVRQVLQDYSLHLENRPKYGLILRGDEKHIRKLRSDLRDRHQDTHEESVTVITRILRDTLQKADYSISEFSFNNLVIHIAIALPRIRKGKLVNVPDSDYANLRDTAEYGMAETIALELAEQLQIHLPESEKAYITMHLLGKRLNDEKNTVVPQEFGDIIDRQLASLAEEYQTSFTKDLNLRLALMLHLLPLSYRLKYDLRMENPLLPSIKANYPHAYIIAKSLAHGLSGVFGKPLSADEIGYLALHINLSLEKGAYAVPKKNIILVCATGRGTARLLEYQYKEKFSGWIRELNCCDVASLKNQDFENVDFVFTTVPIPFPVPVPVMETGFILDEQETVRIQSNIDQQKIQAYFPPDLFFTDVDLSSQAEIIQFLVNMAGNHFPLPETFEDLVWKREDAFTTAFDNGVALPHPYKPCTHETFASTAILKRPVDWGGKPVRIVFLISLAKQEKAGTQFFYKKLSKLLVNDLLLENVCNQATYEYLMDVLASV